MQTQARMQSQRAPYINIKTMHVATWAYPRLFVGSMGSSRAGRNVELTGRPSRLERGQIDWKVECYRQAVDHPGPGARAPIRRRGTVSAGHDTRISYPAASPVCGCFQASFRNLMKPHSIRASNPDLKRRLFGQFIHEVDIGTAAWFEQFAFYFRFVCIALGNPISVEKWLLFGALEHQHGQGHFCIA